MVTIQHFVFVRSTSSLLLPSSDCVQNWDRTFLSICPSQTASAVPPQLFPVFFFSTSLKSDYSHLLLIPFSSFSNKFPNYVFFLFFPSGGPLIYPITYSGLHTHRHTHTSIQTRSCLLCTDKSPLLAGTHSLDYYCTSFCSSPHALEHTYAAL